MIYTGSQLGMKLFMLGTIFLSSFLCCNLNQLSADNNDNQAPLIRRIKVDANAPENWPKPLSQWMAVDHKDFEKLVQNINTPLPEKQNVWIRKIEYSADFVNGIIKNGHFNATVANHSKSPGLLSLSPMNISVDDLKWNKTKAIFGVNREGNAILKVDTHNKLLTGQWDISAVSHSGKSTLDLNLIPANISIIKIKLPSSDILESDNGIVSKIVLDDKQTEWIIHLGSNSKSKLTIQKDQTDNKEKMFILADIDNSYRAEQDRFYFHSQIFLEFTGKHPNQLEFDIPTDFQINSVHWGNDYQLDWKTKHQNKKNNLIVTLPESAERKIHPIHIKGSSSLLTETNQSIYSFIPKHANMRKNRVHLTIQAPLQINKLQHKGFRQTDISILRNNDVTYRFEQSLAEANLDIKISLPTFSFNSHILTHLSVSFEKTTAISEIFLTPVSGNSFNTTFLLDPRWKISSVTSGSSPHIVLDWSLQKNKNQDQQLIIDLRKPLTPDSPQSVIVEVEEVSHSDQNTFSFPILKPVESVIVEQVVSLKITAPSTSFLAQNSSFNKITPEEFPEFVLKSILWKEIEESDNKFIDTLYYYHADNIKNKDVISTTDPLPYSEATSDIVCQIDQDRIIENFSFSIRSTDKTTLPVLIYFNNTSPLLDWSIENQTEVPIQAELIPQNQLVEYNIPPGGELWKISFLSPVQGTFVLKTSRERAFSQESPDLSLATILNSKSFTGTISAVKETFDSHEIISDGAIELSTLHDIPGLPKGQVTNNKQIKQWSFQSPDDKITLRSRTLASLNSVSQLAILELNSVIHESNTNKNFHTATLKFPELSNQSSLEFTLPANAQLVSILLNDKIIRENKTGDLTWKISGIHSKSNQLIQIRYKTGSSDKGIVTNHKIPIPIFDGITIEQLVWKVSVSDKINIYSYSKGLFLESAPRTVRWTERLFGPLGRSRTGYIFNPLYLEDWKALFFNTRNISQDRSLVEQQDNPRTHAWLIHSAKGFSYPKNLKLQTWNYQFISNLAWIGMGLSLILGIHIRSKEYRFRRISGYLWYTIISAISILSVPWIAFPAGGMLCGSIFAILIPRKYLKSRVKPSPSEEIPMGSTVSYHQITGSLILLISLFLPATLSAQKNKETILRTSSENSKSIPVKNQSIDVLIPEGNNTLFKSPLIYLRKADLNHLRSSQQLVPPDYLIKSGHYICSVKNNKIGMVNAIYQIELSNHDKTLAIEIPISNVSLGGDHPCQVNGKDYPITLSKDRNKYIILINGSEINIKKKSTTDNKGDQKNLYTNITVKLSMFPLPDISNNSDKYGMKIPKLPSSVFEIVQQKKQPAYFIVTNNKNVRISKLSEKTEKANIAWLDEIRLMNLNDRTNSQITSPLNYSVASNIQIYPTFLKYDYEIAYKTIPSNVKSLRWALPGEMHIIKITGNCEFDYSISHGQTENNISITLNEPIQDNPEFKIECSFPYVLENEILSIPVKPIHHLSDNGLKKKTNTRYVGIRSYPGTVIEMIKTNKVTATEVIKSDFPNVFDNNRINPASEMILSINSSTEIPLKITSSPILKNADINYEFTINSKDINSTYQINLQINEKSIPVFQHKLKIDPRLKINSISVEEDQANRLLKWTRVDDDITIFLNKNTKGTQQITLVGSVPYDSGKRLKLPDILFKNTIVNKREVVIYQNQNFQKHVRIETIRSGAPTDISKDNIYLLKPLLIHESSLNPDDNLPVIHVLDSITLPEIESFTQIDDSEEGIFEITSWIRFHSIEHPISRLNFQIDHILSMSDLSFQCSNAYLKNTANNNNLIDIFMIPKKGDLKELILTIKYKISSSKDQDFFLPEYHFPDYENQNHFLKQLNDLLFTINITNSKTVSSLNKSPILEFVGALNPGTNLYQFNNFKNIVIRKKINPFKENNNQVILSDTRIWITPNQSLQGSMILIFYSSMNEISLAWPDNIVMTSLTVNGLQQSIPNIVANQTKIPIAPLKTHQTILINWNSKTKSPDHLFHLQNQKFPEPIGMDVHKNLITLIPTKKTSIIPSTGIIHSTRGSHIISWIESILKTYQVAFSSSVFPMDNWTEFVRQVDNLNHSILNHNKFSTVTQIDNHSRLKLKSLTQQIMILNDKVKSRNLEESPVVIASPYIPGFEWTTELPSNAVFGKRSVDSNSGQIQFWCISRNMINAILAFLFCGICLFFSKQVFAFRIGDKLENRSGYCWTLAGLFFWFCLRFSFLGLCLTLIGIFIIIQQEIGIRNNKTEEAMIL